MPDSDNQTLLAFDFGLRRIGVAVGQTVTQTATPLHILLAKQGEPNWQEVAILLRTWKPDGLVVGVPVHLDNTEQTITFAARAFAESLRRFDLPVYEFDERLTTKEARQQLFDQGGYQALQKSPIDSIAAKLILEDWLKNH
jgi:putative Holliday junction resolvase